MIATFDGAKGTSLTWAAENDPVMGGQSVSTFKDDTAQGFGEWSGEVKVVPFLHAPGFCTIRTEHAKIPDMSSYDGMRSVSRPHARCAGVFPPRRRLSPASASAPAYSLPWYYRVSWSGR